MNIFSKMFSVAFMLVLFCNFCAFSQISGDSQLLLDSALKKGKLDNGFTYFLKKTSSLKTEIVFVVKAGFNQEELEQRELAHVLEHMPFIETKHFESPYTFFSQLGIARGNAFNASTGDARTYYYMTIPNGNPEVLPMAFQFFSDCAQNIRFSDKNVENARASVLEEHRLGGSSGMPTYRMGVSLMGETKYRRLAQVNTDSILMVFKRADIERFYKKWYRPSLQAIVVIGNINLEETKDLVSKYFSSLKKRKHISSDVESSDTAQLKWKSGVSIVKDINSESKEIQFAFKLPYIPLRTHSDLDFIIKTKLFNSMLERRFIDYAKSNTYKYFKIPPRFDRDASAFGPLFSAILSNVEIEYDNADAAFREVLTELEKIRRYGFSNTELEAAKARLISDPLLFGSGSDQMYAFRIMEYFVFGDCPLDSDFHGRTIREALSSVSLRSINDSVKKWMTINNNITLTLRVPSPQGISYLSTSYLFEIIDQIRNASIERYEMPKPDDVKLELMTASERRSLSMKMKGQMLTEKLDRPTGITTFAFENGIKVILKPLSGGEEKGIVYLKSRHNKVAYDSSYTQQFLRSKCADIISASGLGALTKDQLNVFLETHRIRFLRPNIVGEDSRFNTSFDASSFEQAIQAIYLYMTNPKVDSRELLNALADTKVSESISSIRSPNRVFADTIAYYQGRIGKPRYSKLSFEALSMLDSAYVRNYFMHRFSATVGTTFVITGDFELTDSILNILGRYFGTIPRQEQVDSVMSPSQYSSYDAPLHILINAGSGETSSVKLEIKGKLESSPKNLQILKLVEEYLNIELFDRLRNKEKGVYGAGVVLVVSKQHNVFTYKVDFVCSPQNVDKLIESVKDEFKKLQVNLVSSDVLAKLKRSRIMKINNSMLTADFWLAYILDESMTTNKFDSILKQQESIGGIDAYDIRSFAANNLILDSFNIYVLSPKL